MTALVKEEDSLSDIDRAFGLYDFLCAGGSEERLFYCVFRGNPVSKHRVYFGKGRAYKRAGQEEAEQTLGWALREALGTEGPFRGNVAVGCVFFRKSHQPVDVDNLLKHVLDAANGVLWADDRQVTAVAGLLEWDAENPRTIIIVGHHSTSLVRDVTISGFCETCGTPFENPGWRKKRQRFCSPACNARSRGQDLSDPIPCRHCGSLFRRRTVSQALCSEGCRAAWLTGKKKAEARPPNYCQDCGEIVPNYRAVRCRSCWQKARKAGLA